MFNTIFGMLRDPVAGNQDAKILGTKPLKANVKKILNAGTASS